MASQQTSTRLTESGHDVHLGSYDVDIVLIFVVLGPPAIFPLTFGTVRHAHEKPEIGGFSRAWSSVLHLSRTAEGIGLVLLTVVAYSLPMKRLPLILLLAAALGGCAVLFPPLPPNTPLAAAWRNYDACKKQSKHALTDCQNLRFAYDAQLTKAGQR
jgi:hypothetical protein